MSPRKLRKLPRQTVWMDERGRIVVPRYLREAANLEVPGWVEIEAYPDLEKCKSLFIIRS